MTIQELLKIEPDLQNLINSAQNAREEPGFNPQTHWAGYFREAVVNATGWFCDDSRLQSSEAYLCLYQHVRSILFRRC